LNKEYESKKDYDDLVWEDRKDQTLTIIQIHNSDPILYSYLMFDKLSFDKKFTDKLGYLC